MASKRQQESGAEKRKKKRKRDETQASLAGSMLKYVQGGSQGQDEPSSSSAIPGHQPPAIVDPATIPSQEEQEPSTTSSDWCYYSQLQWNHTCTAPVLWGLVSQTCNGRSQSPVNIVTSKVLPDERLTPFHFTGYKETFYGSLINTGHSVQLNLPSSIQIKGGNLDDEYKAIQFHLHWGKDGGRGSEHTIDGEKFPMEMHIVHIKEGYDSLAEASKDSTGVAVLGFFFQESESANEKYDHLISALKYISQPKTNVTLLGVSLDMFIPSEINRTKYFRYKGSLTTPDCAEAVVWTLFESTIPLSRNQLAAFNQLRFYDGQKMVNNYRPVQPLNGRQVYYSSGQLALVSSV